MLVSSLLRFFVKNKKLEGKMATVASSTFQGSDGSEYTMDIVSVPELQFGKKMFYLVPAALSVSTEGIDATEKMAGFFGNNFLKRFNTVLDFKSGLIYFQPDNNLHSTY